MGDISLDYHGLLTEIRPIMSYQYQILVPSEQISLIIIIKSSDLMLYQYFRGVLSNEITAIS